MLCEINSAFEAGRLAGHVCFWLLLLAGILKCWSISRRPTTNRKCVFALLLVLLAMLIARVVGELTNQLVRSPGETILVGLLGLVMLGLFAAAVVLAILGLREFSKQRERYVQGRSQAIWALVLLGIIVFFAGAGFVNGLQKGGGFGPASGQSQPGKLNVLEEYNFQFRNPTRNWVSLDASKINKASKLAFIRRNPEATFLIIPEVLGTRLNYSSAQLAELGKASLQANSIAYRVTRETPWRINGLNGVLVETEVQVSTYRLHYRNWYCATNGFAYQLIGFGRTEEQRFLVRDFDELLAQFQLLDPHRIAASAGSFTTNFYSEKNHYQVLLTNSVWQVFPSLKEKFPFAEFGISSGDSCAVVVPANLCGQTLGEDALTAAFLAMLDIPFPNENLTDHKPVAAEGLHGSQYDYSRDVDGKTFRYRMKFLQGNGKGYMAAAWSVRPGPEAEAAINDALARIQFLAATNSASNELTDSESKTAAFILNQAGVFQSKSEESEKVLPFFRAAAELGRDKPVYALNALNSWQHLDRPKEALAFLETRPATVKAVPAIRATQAYFQVQAGLTDQAITNYAGLFATGFRDDLYFTDYINLLAQQREFDPALASIQRYLQKGDSIKVKVLEAQIYRLKKDTAKAISLLLALHEKAPFDTQVVSALIECQLQAGQASEALQFSKELVSNNSSSAYDLFLKGRSELGLKWYREAKISFAGAVKLAPANREIRSYLDYVSGLLGEGDNSALQETISPVAIPESLLTRPVPAGEKFGDNFGAYYIQRLVAQSALSSNELKTTEYFLAKVTDESGVSAFSSVQMAFDPVSEQIFVNAVRVCDAAGKTISEGQVANYYALDDRQGSGVSQKKILNIPVPGLRPGCELAVTITRRQIGRFDEFPFLAHTFAATFPVQESLFFLAGDAHGLKYQMSPAMEPEKLPEGLCWRLKNPMPARWEPLQLPAARILPMLWLADAAGQWPTLGSNYLATISDRLETDSAFQTLAKKLADGLPTDETKISFLANYVQTNLTYKAIEFGRRARVPNSPGDTMRNKYGDCKDHAVLLQQLLLANGIPAQLALATHQSPVKKDLPSLDQFDHMIVYVPAAGAAGRFIDCTSKGADVAHAVPLGLARQEAFILENSHSHFVTIPDYPTSTVSTVQQLRRLNDDDLAVEETLTLTGIHAAILRGYLLQIPESTRVNTLQTQMGMTDVEIRELKVEALQEREFPLRLHLIYSLKKQIHRSDNQLRVSLRSSFLHTYLAASPADNRLTPFELLIPTLIEAKTDFQIPDGYHAGNGKTDEGKLDARFGRCETSQKNDGKKLTAEFKFQQPAGKFLATDYVAYRETMGQALSFLEKEIVFESDHR